MEVMNPTILKWRQAAEEDPDAFWGSAADKLPWFRRWDRVFEWNPPTFSWFKGGLTNISYNSLDVHVQRGWGGHAAIVSLNERGEREVYTYAELLSAVKDVAAALRGAGVKRGDRVGIYMPTSARAVISMLACARIGALHIVVFAGFGSSALAERMRYAGAKLLLTSNLTYRKGKDVQLKGIVDDAVIKTEGLIEKVVVWQRGSQPIAMTEGRDITWEQFMALGANQSTTHEVMESNEPAFILATSGTTARPKLAVHTHGGYQVGIFSDAQWMFGMKPYDIWWSTSDIGWIVGHSYIVYAPLLVGSTTIVYEGALDYPAPSSFYRTLEHEHVTGIFTSPTAVRMLMGHGTAAAETSDLSAVERVFCAGEPLNEPAWEWIQKDVFKNRTPVIDHWWQTETGGPVIGNPYGIATLPIKPGSATIPLPGYSVEIVTPEGRPCGPNERGIVVIKRPFPSLIPTLWGETERYGEDYWKRISGAYYTGDAAMIDEDGYVWFSGRADEIIKIAGHRIGTIEVETALLRHPAVAEAGVTGRPDELRGEVISAFVVVRPGHTPNDELRAALRQTVRDELGAVVVIGDIEFVHILPKTRSGKIMRRVLKAVVTGKDPGDVSTIEDEGSVEEAREAWTSLHEALQKNNQPPAGQ